MSKCLESLLRLWGQPPQGGGNPLLENLAHALCSSGQPPDEVVPQARFLLVAWYVKMKSTDVGKWADNPDNTKRFREIVMKGLAADRSEKDILEELETTVLRDNVPAKKSKTPPIS